MPFPSFPGYTAAPPGAYLRGLLDTTPQMATPTGLYGMWGQDASGGLLSPEMLQRVADILKFPGGLLGQRAANTGESSGGGGGQVIQFPSTPEGVGRVLMRDPRMQEFMKTPPETLAPQAPQTPNEARFADLYDRVTKTPLADLMKANPDWVKFAKENGYPIDRILRGSTALRDMHGMSNDAIKYYWTQLAQQGEFSK